MKDPTTPAPRRLQHGARPVWKEDSGELGASKYSGLTRLAFHYNREFSATQHHAYGCNCMMLGDRPLAETTFGPPGSVTTNMNLVRSYRPPKLKLLLINAHLLPFKCRDNRMKVDELDSTCKKLKECYKCVSSQFGPNCTPEKRNYDFFIRDFDVLPGNRAGSCERALFECDHHYAKQLTSTISAFDMKFNFFVSGFDPISEPSVCALAHSAVKEAQFNQGLGAQFPVSSSPSFGAAPPVQQFGVEAAQFGANGDRFTPGLSAPLVSSDRPLFAPEMQTEFGGVREIMTSQPHDMQCCGGPERQCVHKLNSVDLVLEKELNLINVTVDNDYDNLEIANVSDYDVV